MKISCPSCNSTLIKKNGRIANGKQNHQCLECKRQFVNDPEQKIVKQETRNLVKKTLLERVSLNGITRIFDVSMPWLLDFMMHIFDELPDDLCANVSICEAADVEIAEFEADELWSFVSSKKNRQWLWLAIHRPTKQIIAMHVGQRTQRDAEIFFEKFPIELKKNELSSLISLTLTSKQSQQNSMSPALKVQVKQIILSDLIVRSDSDVLD